MEYSCKENRSDSRVTWWVHAVSCFSGGHGWCLCFDPQTLSCITDPQPCLVSQTLCCTTLTLSCITDPQTIVLYHRPTDSCTTDRLVSQTHRPCLVSQTHKPLYHRPSCITDPQTPVSQTVLYHRPTNPCITDRLVSQTHRPLYHDPQTLVLYQRPSCITDPQTSSCITDPCLVKQTQCCTYQRFSPSEKKAWLAQLARVRGGEAGTSCRLFQRRVGLVPVPGLVPVLLERGQR